MNRKGFTLLELIIVLVMVVVLIGTVSFVFIVSLRAWSSGRVRADIRADLDLARERMLKEIRHAKSIDISEESRITIISIVDFEEPIDFEVPTSYRYYLYNENDPEPNPPYTQATYQLRRSKNDATYGAGVALVEGIVNPQSFDPSRPPFTQSGNLIIIDLNGTREGETIRLRSNVRPRNL